MAQTIAQRIEAEYGEKIRKIENHYLLHILRQEDVHGNKVSLKRWGGKRAFEAVCAIARAELVKRGYNVPEFSSFFLLCNHD